MSEIKTSTRTSPLPFFSPDLLPTPTTTHQVSTPSSSLPERSWNSFLDSRIRVKKGQEASVFYSFVPADAFAGRPIGLTINLAYRDSEGNSYFDPVFNETVSIVEFDEGFDSEVFFMYVFLAAGVILLLFLVYTLATRGSKPKKSATARKAVETGTSNSDA